MGLASGLGWFLGWYSSEEGAVHTTSKWTILGALTGGVVAGGVASKYLGCGAAAPIEESSSSEPIAVLRSLPVSKKRKTWIQENSVELLLGLAFLVLVAWLKFGSSDK